VGKGDRLNIREEIKEITRHLWVLGLSTQATLAIVIPVLVGLGVGWWLDGHLNSRPLITVLLTAAGILVGPFIAYRWVARKVEARLKKEKS
jgi:predicted F0F1-ATPase subunit